MPTGLRRFQQSGDLHFITFSCVRHRLILGTPEARDTFLRILEETRVRYDFLVYACVAMPIHVHLLVSEPRADLLSTAIQVLKQRFSRTRTEEYVGESRYHDFNVQSDDKRAEKLHYIHHNPIKAGLAPTPEDYPWSSIVPTPANTPARSNSTNHGSVGCPTLSQLHRERVGYRFRQETTALLR